VPTKEPTTPEPSFTPTPAPSELPTPAPTRIPTGCVANAATLHVVFKADPTDTDADRAAELATFHVDLAAKLKLTKDNIEIGASTITDTTVKTQFTFAGADSIALGHQLEVDVLANSFTDSKGEEYPIDRLYMEEIFDCGEHLM